MTEQEVLRLAEAHATAQGWPFLQPVYVHLCKPWFFGRPHWDVWSNSRCFGQNVRVIVDTETGAIVSSGFAKR